ncbi:MAG: hypothetical protein WA354_10285 [Terracidiphilus sp.]
MRTARGIRVLDTILCAASDRLYEGLPPWAQGRRVSETTQILRQANDKLFGPIQLTFFDKTASAKTSKKPRKVAKSPTMPKRRTEKAGNQKQQETPKRESLMEQIYG